LGLPELVSGCQDRGGEAAATGGLPSTIRGQWRAGAVRPRERRVVEDGMRLFPNPVVELQVLP